MPASGGRSCWILDGWAEHHNGNLSPPMTVRPAAAVLDLGKRVAPALGRIGLPVACLCAGVHERSDRHRVVRETYGLYSPADAHCRATRIPKTHAAFQTLRPASGCRAFHIYAGKIPPVVGFLPGAHAAAEYGCR